MRKFQYCITANIKLFKKENQLAQYGQNKIRPLEPIPAPFQSNTHFAEYVLKRHSTSGCVVKSSRFSRGIQTKNPAQSLTWLTME
jgi:hypothetical protein